jgi:excisionase family DNA binding protein
MTQNAKVQADLLFENLPYLMTVEEAASFLRKNPKTIRNWIGQRTIPFVKNGNRSMILRDSLAEWLKQQEFKPWQSVR